MGDRKFWSPQGTLDVEPVRESADLTVSRHLGVMGEPGFLDSIDAQAEVFSFLVTHRDALAVETRAKLTGALSLALAPHIPRERLGFILRLETLPDIRAALQRTWLTPRPPTVEEKLYPSTGWLGAHLTHAREANAPIGFHFWTGVATLGALMRRNTYVNLGYRLFPNLYLLIVGNTGLGKSEAIKFARPILETANSEWFYRARNDYTWVKGFPERRVKLLPQDVSPEEFLALLRAQGTYSPFDVEEGAWTLTETDSVGTLIVDELVDLAALGRHNPAGHFHNFTSLYNCETRTKSTRKYRGEDVVDPALTYILGSTVEWINRAIPDDMHEGGFVSRNLVCYRTELGFEHRSLKSGEPPAPPDPVAVIRLARAAAPWMMIRPTEFGFDASARAVMADIWRTRAVRVLERDQPRVADCWKRYQNAVCKLAMILLASEETYDDISTPFTDRVQMLEARPWTITGELLSYARSIIDDEFTRLPEVLNLMGATTDTVRIQRVTDWLQRRGWTKHSEWMRRLAEYWPLTASKVSDQLLETKLVTRQHRKGARGPGTWFYRVTSEAEDEPVTGEATPSPLPTSPSTRRLTSHPVIPEAS